ncbi:uncharacterized protein ARMOST_17940 [Armillaria ostoyae]|uniref:Uncharacterized protein n=1 Tax=Armillaria ostoyae TaxID=47428 RepID=A0A284S0E9_ARMOS|nr:uncharacterized protein ARMOST_17940 [Armillaria ostoyae]
MYSFNHGARRATSIPRLPPSPDLAVDSISQSSSTTNSEELAGFDTLPIEAVVLV